MFNLRDLISHPKKAQPDLDLRPTCFADYIGQEKLKKNLRYIMDAANYRREPLEHILLYGAAGLGKTTMALVIANEMRARLRITSAPIIEEPNELVSLLTKLSEGDVLFIDEIHRLKPNVEEVLYSAMEDYKVDVMLGKDKNARSLRLELPKFTLIGATTHAGELSAPLRDRFGLVCRLDYYTLAELTNIVRRSAKILNIDITPDAAQTIASRARMTPRIANRLIKRTRDFAQSHGQNTVTDELAAACMAVMEIDELGLDTGDRLVLNSIIDNFNGGPVGVDALAATTGEDRATIVDFYEPYLLKIGLLERTPRGRKATNKAYEYLQKTV